MHGARFGIPACLAILLAGCGTYVPNIQEFPGDTVEGQRLVTAIVRNVKCELRDALADLHRIQSKTFLDDWGVLVTLNLTFVEKTSVNPVVSWLPPSPADAVFKLGLGGAASAEATRINKLGSFYSVRELTKLDRCTDRRDGPFLLKSDLKLNEWLVAAATVGNTGGSDFSRNTPDGPFKQEVLSHEVKFVVTSSLDATPQWTLTRAVLNPDGTTFFNANRDRTHDLIITFGPMEFAKGPGGTARAGPSRIAADSALASQIGASVANNLRRALPR